MARWAVIRVIYAGECSRCGTPIWLYFGPGSKPVLLCAACVKS